MSSRIEEFCDAHLNHKALQASQASIVSRRGYVTCHRIELQTDTLFCLVNVSFICDRNSVCNNYRIWRKAKVKYVPIQYSVFSSRSAELCLEPGFPVWCEAQHPRHVALKSLRLTQSIHIFNRSTNHSNIQKTRFIGA